MKRIWYAVGAAAALGLLATVFYSLRTTVPASVVEPTPASSQAASAPAPTVPESASHHPIDPRLAGPASAQPFDLQSALADLFGLRTVQSTFRLDEFPRRLVATVDNLGRSRASALLWPLIPAGGRFTVEQRDGSAFIGADNGLRYTPYVLLLETVDLRRLAALYARIYPSLQRAYEELGYPRGYFNDRLVEVIDQLLATPEADMPLEVHLPSLNSDLHPERPWVLYQFTDPSLESLSSGQKILLRMGPVNARRVKARFAEFRGLVTAPARKR